MGSAGELRDRSPWRRIPKRAIASVAGGLPVRGLFSRRRAGALPGLYRERSAGDVPILVRLSSQGVPPVLESMTRFARGSGFIWDPVDLTPKGSASAEALRRLSRLTL